jgi:hypothetical protein
MGRPSKLSDKKWADIERRLIKGESAIALAREYGVDRAAVSRRFSQPIATVKAVANQLLNAEISLKALPLTQQINAISILDQLRSISGHLAGAANFGAATAHRLSGIAHGKVSEIDDAAPLDDESMNALKGIAVLTKLANDSSQIGINLLNANKDLIKEQNSGGGQSSEDFMKELVKHLPD